MLSQFRDRVSVLLAPDRIAIKRTKAGSKRKDLAEKVYPVNQDHVLVWSAAIAKLEEAVAENELNNANIEIVVSNRFVQYVLIPWNSDMVEHADYAAWVRHCVSKTHGSAAMQWDIRHSIEGFGQPVLAAALDRELQVQLARALARPGLRLISVEPWLVGAFNFWRRKMQGDAVWFVMIEPMRLYRSQDVRAPK